MFESTLSPDDPPPPRPAPSPRSAPPHRQWSDLQPGAQSLADLTACFPADSSDADLIEQAIGWDRLAALCAARQADVIAEFVSRRVATLGSGEWASKATEFAADEIAAALRLNRRAANDKVAFAQDLQRLPDTHEALEAGNIDARRAQVVCAGTRRVSDQVGRSVEAVVIGLAAEQTTGQLRHAVANAVLAVDPAGAQDRHDRAKKERNVQSRPDEDGMGTLSAHMPADTLARVNARINAGARAAKTAGDTRSIAARRLDTLVDLILSPCPHHRPDDQPSPSSAAGSTPGGGDETPAAAPIPAGRGEATAGSPAGEAHAGAPSSPADSAAEATTAEHGVEAAGGCVRSVSAVVHVTVGVGTLMGVNDLPGEIAGYGPIPADMARDIAADGVWKRLLVDPSSGALVDFGRNVYRPPAALRDFVRARDRTCRKPGCLRPAHQCDIDHTVPFPEGPTNRCNNGVHCRHHHLMKHHAGWSLQQDETGVFTWTTPTGHIYKTYPHDFRPPDAARPRDQASGEDTVDGAAGGSESEPPGP